MRRALDAHRTTIPARRTAAPDASSVRREHSGMSPWSPSGCRPRHQGLAFKRLLRPARSRVGARAGPAALNRARGGGQGAATHAVAARIQTRAPPPPRASASRDGVGDRCARRLDRGRVRLMSTKNSPMTISPRPRAPDGGFTEREPERACAPNSGRRRICRQVEDAIERPKLARALGGAWLMAAAIPRRLSSGNAAVQSATGLPPSARPCSSSSRARATRRRSIGYRAGPHFSASLRRASTRSTGGTARGNGEEGAAVVSPARLPVSRRENLEVDPTPTACVRRHRPP